MEGKAKLNRLLMLDREEIKNVKTFEGSVYVPGLQSSSQTVVLKRKLTDTDNQLASSPALNTSLVNMRENIDSPASLWIDSEGIVDSNLTNWRAYYSQNYSDDFNLFGDGIWNNFNLSDNVNMSCTNGTCEGWLQNLPGLYRHNFATGFILCTGYILIFILGLIGNSFVMVVVFRSPRMRTVTNYFIVNLAVADVLVIVFCLPANLISSIYVPWMLGWFMCKSFTYVQTVSVSASVNSLIAVSLDRFLAIWFPLRPQITKRTACTLIVLIWIVAMVTAIPMAVYFDLVSYDALPKLTFCVEVWPSRAAEKWYFLIAHLLLCYLLPLKLISAFYIMIWIKVAKRTIPGDSRDAALRAMQQRSKIKVVKMLAVVVLIFMLSWLPLYIVFARMKLGGELDEVEMNVVAIVTPVAQWLGASNSCINPILYAFLNKKFRSGFLTLIRRRTCCCSLRNDDIVSSTIRGSSHLPLPLRGSTTRLGKGTEPHKRKVVFTVSGSSAYSHQNKLFCHSFEEKKHHHLPLTTQEFCGGGRGHSSSSRFPAEPCNKYGPESPALVESDKPKEPGDVNELETLERNDAYPLNGTSNYSISTTTTIL